MHPTPARHRPREMELHFARSHVVVAAEEDAKVTIPFWLTPASEARTLTGGANNEVTLAPHSSSLVFANSQVTTDTSRPLRHSSFGTRCYHERDRSRQDGMAIERA